MTKRMRKSLTPLEGLIMNCVWDRSRATVREVQEALRDTKPMAYNTVLTVMRILREKGFLSSEREGRTDVYSPAVSRERMGRRSLTEVLERFFAGSPRMLVSELLESDEVSPEEIRAIRREIDKKLRAQ